MAHKKKSKQHKQQNPNKKQKPRSPLDGKTASGKLDISRAGLRLRSGGRLGPGCIDTAGRYAQRIQR